MLYLSGFDDCHSLREGRISDEELWRALQSLTKVQSVDIESKTLYANCMTAPFPNGLFQSATSMRLMGQMHYGLAKAILTSVNPATLKHLCLDMVQDPRVGYPRSEFVPGDRGEDGRVIALGASSGLLTPLTGRCTSLQTLILRRIGQAHSKFCWHVDAEDESYIEWASFIRSVQGTVERLTFEQSGGLVDMPHPRQFRIMHDRFRALILPAIVSGNRPCLNAIELRGVRVRTDEEGGTAALRNELSAILGANAKIVVEEDLAWAICLEFNVGVGVRA